MRDFDIYLAGLGKSTVRISDWVTPTESEATVYHRLLRLYQHEVSLREKRFIATSEITANMNLAVSWILNNSQNRRNLLFRGTVGNGKSTMAAAFIHLCHYYMEQERDCMGRTLCKDRFRVLQPFNISSLNKESYENCKTCDYLFIDDVGLESKNLRIYGTEIEPIKEILLSRYASGKLTLMTTNLELEELSERYGEAIADRIIEMFDVIPFKEKSFRPIS